MKEIRKGEILIYKNQGNTDISVKFENDSVWLTQAQLAELFQTDRTSIGKHIKNILKSSELSQNSVCAIFAHTGPDGKTYKVQYYSLDMVISVGYRVNSKRATQFRIWATSRLKEYLLQGFSLNEKRLRDFESLKVKLKELESAHKLIGRALESRKLEGYEKDLLKIITDYSDTWFLLNSYDKGEISAGDFKKIPGRILNHGQLTASIVKFKERLMAKKQASELFGQEVSGKFEALLGNIFQTYGGKELYPSLEEKAGHLLYFCIKNHPFADGNKRIGSLVFLLFLVENNFLHDKKGEKKISDNALTALALLVAESSPKDKEVMVKLIASLIRP